MTSSFGSIKIARELRSKGYSYVEIARECHIAKSTAHSWTKKIKLSLIIQNQLKDKLRKAREKALLANTTKRLHVKEELVRNSESTIDKITLTKEIKKLVCAIFLWTEGGKLVGSHVSFMNSDSLMIMLFLKLFRESFDLDEKKLRALVHIHSYHNDIEVKKYWSEATAIPLTQFTKSYKKPNTRKRIRDNYQGCIRINYYDYKIALELRFLYNIFARTLLNKGRSSTVE
ncbi:MAG: hypothetical protein Q7S61_04855 [bacterium]|nr:hypothetical protein [bacterium]